MEAATATNGTTEKTRPVVVDLGKVKAKKIKQLKRGQGSLLAEVDDAVETAVNRLGAEAQGRVMVPVIVIYRKKSKRKSGGVGFFR